MKRCDQTLLAVTLFLFIAVSPARAFYNPAAGRWLNRDPIEEKGGKNLCAFAENAPLLKFDPDGKIVITQLKWEKGECGKYTVEWDFKLSNPAPLHWLPRSRSRDEQSGEILFLEERSSNY